MSTTQILTLVPQILTLDNVAMWWQQPAWRLPLQLHQDCCSHLVKVKILSTVCFVFFPKLLLYYKVKPCQGEGEILVYARALHALPALPYCFNSLPFIDGALQIWVALPVSKSHLLIVVIYDFHFFLWFISWMLTVIEDGSCCKWMEWQEIQQHLCSWWGD